MGVKTEDFEERMEPRKTDPPSFYTCFPNRNIRSSCQGYLANSTWKGSDNFNKGISSGMFKKGHKFESASEGVLIHKKSQKQSRKTSQERESSKCSKTSKNSNDIYYRPKTHQRTNSFLNQAEGQSIKIDRNVLKQAYIPTKMTTKRKPRLSREAKKAKIIDFTKTKSHIWTQEPAVQKSHSSLFATHLNNNHLAKKAKSRELSNSAKTVLATSAQIKSSLNTEAEELYSYMEKSRKLEEKNKLSLMRRKLLEAASKKGELDLGDKEQKQMLLKAYSPLSSSSSKLVRMSDYLANKNYQSQFEFNPKRTVYHRRKCSKDSQSIGSLWRPFDTKKTSDCKEKDDSLRRYSGKSTECYFSELQKSTFHKKGTPSSSIPFVFQDTFQSSSKKEPFLFPREENSSQFGQRGESEGRDSVQSGSMKAKIKAIIENEMESETSKPKNKFSGKFLRLVDKKQSRHVARPSLAQTVAKSLERDSFLRKKARDHHLGGKKLDTEGAQAPKFCFWFPNRSTSHHRNSFFQKSDSTSKSNVTKSELLSILKLHKQLQIKIDDLKQKAVRDLEGFRPN